jgi:hypothetical protein
MIIRITGSLPLTRPVDDPQQCPNGNPRRPLRTVRLGFITPRRPGNIEMSPRNSIRKFF